MSIESVQLFEKLGFIPIQRSDLKPYKMEMPFDWGVNPYDDPNWCFQLHTLRYLMVYLSAYKEGGDESYLIKLIGWFRDWWHWTEKNMSEFSWHDMATGIRAEKIYQIVEEMNKNKILTPVWMREMILEHVRVIREPGFIRVNHNHGLYAVHGLRCLAELLGPGMKASVIRFCYKKIAEIIKNQFDGNYVHKEHSPHYHKLVLESLKKYKETKLYDDLYLLGKYIEGAENVSSYLCLPDGREIPFGDTDYEKPRREDQLTKCGMSSWCKSGYAVVRDGLGYLCVTNNFNNRVHKHWDNLSLIYGVKGTDILVDPGKYKYIEDELRRWVVSSESHNTINIKDFSWGERNIIKKSLLLNVDEMPERIRVVGAMSVLVNNEIVGFNREIEFSNDELLVIDTVLRKNNFEVYSRFNFHKDFSVRYKDGLKIVLGVKDFEVEVSVGEDGENAENGCSGCIVERVPISYGYGKVEESVSLKIFNNGFLKTKFKVMS